MVKRRKSQVKHVKVGEVEVGGGFKVLKWRLHSDSSSSPLSNETNDEANSYFEFFIKNHDVRETNSRKPRGRTLFVINIPPFFSEKSLRDLFIQFGEIVEIFLHQNPSIGLAAEIHPYFPDENNLINGFKVAYIVFKDPKSVVDLLGTNDVPTLEAGPDLSTGLEKWISNYNNTIIPISVLEEDIKNFMINFEKEEIQRIQEEKNNEGQPDEDGWVKVTRRGKRPGTQRTEKTEEKLKAKKRRFEKQLLNFTPTQIKETRAKELVDLKRKFDEDKQRVALLKQSRRFKPF